jgi:CDP-diacylglycerol--glycerol-3-phosphate 3-phosphatidyltransferase
MFHSQTIGGHLQSIKNNLANIVTLLRVFLTPLFVVFMVMSNTSPGYRYAALAVFVFGAVTDWVDGQVARRMKIVTKFGIMVDPLADRLFIGATIITLYCMRMLPLLYLVIVLGRDLLMVVGYPFIRRIDPEKVAVHITGKIATATLFVALGCLILAPPPHTGSYTGFSGYAFTSPGTWQFWGLWLFAIGAALSLWSAGIYISRVIELLREEDAKEAGRAADAGDPA